MSTRARSGTTLVAIACGYIAVALGGAPSGGTHVARAALLAGSALIGLGVALLLRRRFAAAPPNGHDAPLAAAFAQFLAAVEDRRRAVPAALVAGAGMSGALATGPLGVAVGGVGVLCIGAFTGAGAALGCLVGGVVALAGFDSLSDPLGSPAAKTVLFFGYVVLAVQSVLVLPQTIRAFHEHAPWRRVRFEIGGLGTRVEDTTPLERQDHGAFEALLVVLAGAVLVIANHGPVALGDAALAVGIAPALASLATTVGSPIVLLGISMVARDDVANLPFTVTAASIALAMDVQRLAVLRGGRPADVPRWIALGALVASAVRAAWLDPLPRAARWPRFEAILEPAGWIVLCASGIALVWAAVSSFSSDELTDPSTRATDASRPAGFALHVPALVVLGIALPSVVVGFMVVGAALGAGLSSGGEHAATRRGRLRDLPAALVVAVAVAIAAAVALVA